MLDEIGAALARIEDKGSFATRSNCPSDDLRLEVGGVGPIRFPVSATSARKLCKVARPAAYGRGTRTLTDPKVRDTWVIAKSRVKIDQRRWNRTLEPQLGIIRNRLGLGPEAKLEAELQNLLVYAPGQFFVPHQDSEKSDDMVGTLVVVLPSVYTGGSSIAEHRGRRMTFRARTRPSTDLQLIAFYADCRHEVRPVKSGYRIVLTYNLLYRTPPSLPRVHDQPAAIEELRRRVGAYFSPPAPPRGSAPRPDCLVYLLDHEYTRRSLGWGRLKSGDRSRAAALRHVGAELDCDVCLALADVHESWGCEGDEGWGDGGWSSDDGDYELTELYDTDFELRHWIDLDGKPMRGMPGASWAGEACATTPSVDLTPFRFEHEGFMGNWGNTVDRWYHRAAVVLSPRERRFVIRAKVSPKWAIGRVASLLERRRPDPKEARARAASLLPFWQRASRVEGDDFFARTIEVARSLDDAGLATGLLRPFGPHRLSDQSLPGFAALVRQHGLKWSRELFSIWGENTRWNTPPWLHLLPRVCAALYGEDGSDEGRALARWLLAEELAGFERRWRKAMAEPYPSRDEAARLERHNDDAIGLLAAAAVAGDGSTRDALLAFLMAEQTAYPVAALGELLQGCRPKGRYHKTLEALSLDPPRLGLDRLYDHVVRVLERLQAEPARGPNDWSIEPPGRCRCRLCRELARFLRDPDRVVLRWPLAKQRRYHVHRVIDAHGLPLSHTTERSGSPHKLVLKKRRTLFRQEAERRTRRRTLLRALAKLRRRFTAT